MYAPFGLTPLCVDAHRDCSRCTWKSHPRVESRPHSKIGPVPCRETTCHWSLRFAQTSVTRNTPLQSRPATDAFCLERPWTMAVSPNGLTMSSSHAKAVHVKELIAAASHSLFGINTPLALVRMKSSANMRSQVERSRSTHASIHARSSSVISVSASATMAVVKSNRLSKAAAAAILRS